MKVDISHLRPETATMPQYLHELLQSPLTRSTYEMSLRLVIQGVERALVGRRKDTVDCVVADLSAAAKRDFDIVRQSQSDATTDDFVALFLTDCSRYFQSFNKARNMQPETAEA